MDWGTYNTLVASSSVLIVIPVSNLLAKCQIPADSKIMNDNYLTLLQAGLV